MAGGGAILKRPARPELEPSMEQFATALRRLVRVQAGVKVMTLAAETKMSKSAASRYLRGQSFPPDDFVDAAVTMALRRLAHNSAYITVDVNAELFHWQTAWAHVESAQHSRAPAAPASPDTAGPAQHQQPPVTPIEQPSARPEIAEIDSDPGQPRNGRWARIIRRLREPAIVVTRKSRGVDISLRI